MPGHTTGIQACRGAQHPRHHHRLRHCIKRPQSTVPTSRGDTVLTTQQAALLPGGKRHGQVPRVLCTSIAAPPHISQAPLSIVGCVRHTEPALTDKERCKRGKTQTSSRTPDRPQQTETAHYFSAYYCANHSTLFSFPASTAAAAGTGAAGAETPCGCCTSGNHWGPGPSAAVPGPQSPKLQPQGPQQPVRRPCRSLNGS